MDKRTLFFLSILFGTLFFVNLYFTEVNQEKERLWHEQQRLKKERIEQVKSSEIAKRTPTIEAFTLIDLYADDAGSQFLSSAVAVDDTLLTIGWSDKIPAKIYVRPHGTTENYVPYYLNQPKRLENEVIKTLGEPIVFSKDGNQPLNYVDMPLFGHYDLALVTFYKNEIESPISIGLGEYVDGKFTSLSYEPDVTKIPPPPIVLFKTTKGFLPVGVVSPIKENLVELEDFDTLRNFIQKEKESESKEDKVEKFYVLENEYQQIVFSNIGGSISEINLPFKSSKDSVSVVKPVEVDRRLKVDDPKQALYPLYPHYVPGTDGTPILEKKSVLSNYYPLLRRDFVDQATGSIHKIPHQYYALNIVSEYPEVAELVYKVKEFDKTHIVFEAEQLNRKITKTYRLLPTDQSAPYSFDLKIDIDGDSKGLWLTTGVPEAEWIAGAIAPALKYRLTKGNKGSVDSIDLPPESITNTSLNPDWVCNSNGFFGMILDPLNNVGGGFRATRIPGANVPSRLIALIKEYPQWNAQDLPGYMMLMPLKSGIKSSDFRVYAGPFATHTLNEVDARFTDPVTKENPDYISCQTYHGFFTFISQPFAKFLWWIMDFAHKFTNSWALSIVIATIVLRILLYPLNTWSTKSMLKLQEIAPEVQRIQEKYKNNKQKAQQEIMELYRKKKANPLGGCLPLLIQMPFLMGMFDLLKSSFELRGASFIPGWIDDLASPDVLFSWDFHIPLIGSDFHLLPFILGGLMFAQARMSSTGPADVSQMTDQQRQQRAMMTIMPIFMTLIFYNFPSGLNIYWISSTVLGMLQQWRMSKKLKKAT